MNLINNTAFTEQLSNAFQQPELHESPNVIHHKDAFPVAAVDGAFDTEFLQSVRSEVMQLRFHQKRNDLYQFIQSDDLSRCSPSNPALNKLHQLLCSTEFIDWIQRVTGVQLHSGRIDMAAQRYSRTDHLLCHDDDITDGVDSVRRVAFIIYLVTPPFSEQQQWNGEEDGGRLELFSARSTADGRSVPGSVVCSLSPKWNTMAFFEVTPTSYHQVSEVLAVDKERVSLTGWFYGPPVDFTVKDVATQLEHSLPVAEQEEFCSVDLATWLNPVYLKRQSKRQILKQFIRQSVLELQQFLKADALNGLLTQLQSSPVLYPIGPANSQRYHICQLASVQQFMQSTEWLEYLRQITNLPIVSNQSAEVQIFRQGDYTMLNDETLEADSALDVLIHLSGSGNEWTEDCGGQLVYINDEDTLLQIQPQLNSMSVVYRAAGSGVKRFVEYLNCKAPGERIVISATYPVLAEGDQVGK